MGRLGVCTSPNGVLNCKSSTCPGSSINCNLTMIRSGALDDAAVKETWNAVASDLAQLLPHEQEEVKITLKDYEQAALEKTPVMNDTHLGELYSEIYKVMSEVASFKSLIESDSKKLAPSYEYFRESNVPHLEKRITESEAKIVKLEEQLGKLLSAAAVFEKAWEDGGRWSRAFLVTNGNGHVHKTRNCSTCYPTTQFVWLPQYSGQSEELIVEDAGMQACTICYPDAPVDVLKRASKIDNPLTREDRMQKQADKAEREAKKKATGIWNVDGSELKVKNSWSTYSETLKTERTAQIWVTDSFIELENIKTRKGDLNWDQEHLNKTETMLQDQTEKVIEAIAAKRGVSVDSVRDELKAKAAKKRKAQGW